MSTRIEIKSTGSSRSTAKLMKTGQTISYRTGDDGDFEAGRNTSFLVLDSNNPFDNTDRFTDEFGGQTYTSNIVIDWSTYNGSSVLGWYRIPQGPSDWNTAIDNSVLTSVSTYTSGWRLPNVTEYFSIMKWDINNTFNYSPFNLINLNYFTSTTNRLATGNAMGIVSNGLIQTRGKLIATNYICCRDFTWNGTSLT